MNEGRCFTMELIEAGFMLESRVALNGALKGMR